MSTSQLTRSLPFHRSIPSWSTVPSATRRHPPPRKSARNCTLPGLSTTSVTPSIHDSLQLSAPGTGRKSTTIVAQQANVDSLGHLNVRALQSAISLVVALAMTIGVQRAPSSQDTFEDVPQTLSGGEKVQRIQKPKSAKAESCTRKCVTTCIRGGAGAPGEGPLNVERPLVVFKEGFRSRQYCLIECSEICNLIGDGS